ncbi:MAG: protein-tyrosine kinase [Lachnospiraceae bacterium]|nr:protein-tyrosine kinase [Lachnospiraceae bacterium]
MGNREDEIEIDLAEVLGFLFHWLWLIILGGLICGSIGLVISAFVISPKYESTTKVYILNKQNNNGSISYSDTQLATQLTKDYEELITCRNVLEKVISELKLDDSYETLKNRITVANASDTRIISITVKDESPEEARRIANGIRDAASSHITQVMDIEAVNIVDEANLPDVDKPAEPSVVKYTGIGGFIGIFICVAALLIKYLTDDTIRVSEDVEKYLELSTLGLIPVMEQDDDKGKDRKRKKKKRRSSSSEKYENPLGAVDDDTDVKLYETSSSTKAERKNRRNATTGTTVRASAVSLKSTTLRLPDIDSLDEDVTIAADTEADSNE